MLEDIVTLKAEFTKQLVTSPSKCTFVALIVMKTSHEHLNQWSLRCDTKQRVLCWRVTLAFCRRTEGHLFSQFQVKQRDADTVDLWITNSLLLPFAVMNASLSQKLLGVMKVCTNASPLPNFAYSKPLCLCQDKYELGKARHSLPWNDKDLHRTGIWLLCLCCPLPVRW